jgi:hypothetical protein
LVDLRLSISNFYEVVVIMTNKINNVDDLMRVISNTFRNAPPPYKVVINNSDFVEGNNTKLHLTSSDIDNYDLDTLQNIVGGNIEIIQTPWGKLVINENGKLEGLQTNITATTVWFTHFGVTDLIVGNAIYFLDEIPVENLVPFKEKTIKWTKKNINMLMDKINSVETKLDWEVI